MNWLSSRHLSIGLAMLVAIGLSLLLTPRMNMARQGPRIDLAGMIPVQFGEWRTDENQVAVVVNPEVTEKLYGIYDQTLVRTYVNPEGETIMLSIAYGSNQVNERLQVHRPEFCYRSGGYDISQNKDGHLVIDGVTIPVRRLEARLGSRYEPISYWVTVGGKATLPGLNRKLAQIVYGLTGKVADGMLVRVSSIRQEAAPAYALQDRFIVAMVAAIKPADRARFIGAI